MRPFVMALAALRLALSASVGLAMPASAGASEFTGSVQNLPVTVSSTLHFQGFKPVGSAITSVLVSEPANVTVTLPASDCTGLGKTSNTWNCHYTPTGGFVGPGSGGSIQGSIDMVLTESTGAIEHEILTFDVYNDGTSTPTTSVYALMTYQFKPDEVVVTSTPSAGATQTTSEQLEIWESGEPDSGCPANPLNTAPYTCDFTGLVDNTLGDVYENSDIETIPALGTGEVDNFFQELPPPTETSIKNDGNQRVTVSGSGFENPAAIEVLNEHGTVVCRTTVLGTGGTWSCKTPTALGAGTHHLTAVTEDLGFGFDDQPGYYINGALSAPSNVKSIVLAAVPVSSGSHTAFVVPALITPNWSFTISGDPNDIHPGDTLTVNGSGLPGGVTIDTVLHSIPVDLGKVVTAADGTFDQTVTIPADTVPGAHAIIVTASGSGINTSTEQQAITVVAPSTGSGKTGTGGHTHGGGSTAPTTVGSISPNILTRALTPFADVASHPSKILSAIEIGLVLLLLAVLPAHLLNATIAEQSDRFTRRFPRLSKRPRWLTALGAWLHSAPVVGGIIVTTVTAILFGFADPKFGFTLASLRLILACAIALFFVGYVANALTGAIARARWGVAVSVSIRPYGLILTVVGVLVSRLLHFSPGFLIGLILGLAIQGKSAAGYAWRMVLLRTGIVLGLAILAWIGYSTLTLGGDEGGAFGSQLFVETLVAITTEGVVALLVELLPLRFLEGERLYAHSKPLWATFYVLTVIVFVLAVVPWEGNWDVLGSSLWVWIAVLALFALVCIGVYVYFRRFAPPLEEEAGDETVALGETVAGDLS